jgi:hypothetical protein
MLAQPAVSAMALAGAVLMPVSLFVDWYGVKAGAHGEDFGAYKLDGWDAFESTDALMVLVALSTAALVVLSPSFAGRALLLAGTLTAGWITVQLVDGAGLRIFLHRSDLSLQIGAWLGLLGAVLIAGAGALSRFRSARTIGG